MNTRRRLIRTTATAAALALGTLTLSACGGDSAASGDGKVDVMASFYPLEFLAEEIGGKHVSVSGLTEPGVEPHDLDLSLKKTARLGEADVVVYLKGFQPAVDEAVELTDGPRFAEAGSFTSLETLGEEKHAEEGHSGGEHAEEGHAEEGHAEEGHEGHDHGGEGAKDPHVWLDPVRYAEIAEGVGKELAEADPDHKAAYEKNTDALVKRLKSLDGKFEEGLSTRKSDTFITTHAAFGYLAERYGLHQEAIAGLDPESGSVSGARIKELHRIAAEDDVSTVFFESRASDDTARTLAGDLDLKTDVLNPLEGVANPEKQDYFSVMQDNLKALRTALDAR